VRVISDGSCKGLTTVPSCGFTQRATIDAELDEIHILTGMSKDRDKADAVQNSLWIYDISSNKWTCVYSRESTSEFFGHKTQHEEPVPRYAHQFVYNPVTKVHYLFGGNPGASNQLKMRLDDFWLLRLYRPTHQEVLRTCKYTLRKCHYEELCVKDPVKSVRFLQTTVSHVVDHSNKEEVDAFESLPLLLFKEDSDLNKEYHVVTLPSSSSTHSSSSSSSSSEHFYSKRTELFDKLVLYFPEDMSQPRQNILELVTIH